jgi:hypothetical protein
VLHSRPFPVTLPGMKNSLSLALACLALLCVPDQAGAAPDAPGARSAVRPTFFAPKTPARLDRYRGSHRWQQSTPPKTKCQPAVGQYSCIPCSDPCWRWKVGLPLWIPGIDSNAAKGNVRVNGDRPDGDLVNKSGGIFSNLEFAFVGSLSARKGRWGAGVDFLTASVDATASFSIGNGLFSGGAEGTFDASIARARIDYLYARSLAPWHFGTCGCAEHRIYAGARGYDVRLQAVAVGNPALNADIGDTWVDPIIGLESHLPFARNWSVMLAGDLGGWGIDGNWSWNLLAGVAWRFARTWSIGLAYNVLDLRRTIGPAIAPQKIDVNLRGPQLALHLYL